MSIIYAPLGVHVNAALPDVHQQLPRQSHKAHHLRLGQGEVGGISALDLVDVAAQDV